jgi:hypothetical protein
MSPTVLLKRTFIDDDNGSSSTIEVLLFTSSISSLYYHTQSNTLHIKVGEHEYKLTNRKDIKDFLIQFPASYLQVSQTLMEFR